MAWLSEGSCLRKLVLIGHSTNSPVYGLGQGSTVSATGWGKLVSMVLDLHNKHQVGSHYSDPEGEFETIIGKLSYVDNNNMSNNGAPHESTTDVIWIIQHDAQL